MVAHEIVDVGVLEGVSSELKFEAEEVDKREERWRLKRQAISRGDDTGASGEPKQGPRNRTSAQS